MSLLFPERRLIGLAPAFGGEPWQDAVVRLGALGGKPRATVILSNHFVRYAIVPWSDALSGEAEEQAYVRHHFAKVHGERARGWALRWSDNGAGTRLCSAIDAELLAELKRALPRLASVQPYLMAAVNRCRKAIPKSGAWLALVEDARACVALHADGGWRSVTNMRASWLELLERERLRAHGASPALALVQGAKTRKAQGWEFRELAGGLAH